MERVEVSRAAPGDERALAEFATLLVEYETSLDRELQSPDIDAEVETLGERYAAGALYLARRDGTPVGCIAVHRHDERTAEIKRFYVAPSARGAGIGRRLLETAVAFARDTGCARVVLDTHRERLHEAYRLYRSAGFVECTPYGDVAYACPTFMERLLGSP